MGETAGRLVGSLWMNLRLCMVRGWRELVARSSPEIEAIPGMGRIRVEEGTGASSLLPDEGVEENTESS